MGLLVGVALDDSFFGTPCRLAGGMGVSVPDLVAASGSAGRKVFARN